MSDRPDENDKSVKDQQRDGTLYDGFRPGGRSEEQNNEQGDKGLGSQQDSDLPDDFRPGGDFLNNVEHQEGDQQSRDVTTPKGRRLTEHAIESTSRHGVSLEMIDNIMDNPSRTTTQDDGARVYIQRGEGRARSYNLVVEGDDGIVTAMKGLSPSELKRLGKNNGFDPNP